MFHPPSFTPFCVTSHFWMTSNEGTTEKAIENTTKGKIFVYLFWRLCNSIYIFTKGYMNPVIPATHPSSRVLCILYLHIVDKISVIRFYTGDLWEMPVVLVVMVVVGHVIVLFYLRLLLFLFRVLALFLNSIFPNFLYFESSFFQQNE